MKYSYILNNASVSYVVGDNNIAYLKVHPSIGIAFFSNIRPYSPKPHHLIVGELENFEDIIGGFHTGDGLYAEPLNYELLTKHYPEIGY